VDWTVRSLVLPRLVAACGALVRHQHRSWTGSGPGGIAGLQQSGHNPVGAEHAESHRQKSRATDKKNNQKGIHRLIPYLAATWMSASYQTSTLSAFDARLC
jgi:hypothetical protein